MMSSAKYISLSNLRPGMRGVIRLIHNLELSNSLMAMGLLPGDTFEVTAEAPFGGPLAIEVEGVSIAIRKEDAALVEVELQS